MLPSYRLHTKNRTESHSKRVKFILIPVGCLPVIVNFNYRPTGICLIKHHVGSGGIEPLSTLRLGIVNSIR